VAYEVGGNTVEADADYEAVDFESFGIGYEVHSKDSVAFVARGMLACAKPNLPQFALASITLVSWLASGHSASEVRDNVDNVINAQGIEGIVGMLRSHQASIEACMAAAGALTRIAVSAMGATAVATRGGSRQITRMLHATAAMRKHDGDVLLLTYLRLLDTCAAGGTEAADILRRQGVVDAVVGCVDAGTDRDFRGEEEDAAAAADAAKPGAAAETSASSNYATEPGLRADIDTTITSILSRLVPVEMVHETVAQLQAYADELSNAVVNSAYNPKKALQLQDYAKAKLVRAVVRLGEHADAQDALAKLRAGLLGNISVGYSVEEEAHTK
jgi:hypothetical protein